MNKEPAKRKGRGSNVSDQGSSSDSQNSGHQPVHKTPKKKSAKEDEVIEKPPVVSPTKENEQPEANKKKTPKKRLTELEQLAFTLRKPAVDKIAEEKDERISTSSDSDSKSARAKMAKIDEKLIKREADVAKNQSTPVVDVKNAWKIKLEAPKKPTVKPTVKPAVKPTVKPTMKPAVKPTMKAKLETVKEDDEEAASACEDDEEESEQAEEEVDSESDEFITTKKLKTSITKTQKGKGLSKAAQEALDERIRDENLANCDPDETYKERVEALKKSREKKGKAKVVSQESRFATPIVKAKEVKAKQTDVAPGFVLNAKGEMVWTDAAKQMVAQRKLIKKLALEVSSRMRGEKPIEPDSDEDDVTFDVDNVQLPNRANPTFQRMVITIGRNIQPINVRPNVSDLLDMQGALKKKLRTPYSGSGQEALTGDDE